MMPTVSDEVVLGAALISPAGEVMLVSPHSKPDPGLSKDQPAPLIPS